MELNSAGKAGCGSSEDIKIENVKKQIKDKCSKLQTKLHKINKNLDGTVDSGKNPHRESIPSTSSSRGAKYVASRNDLSNEKIKIKEKISSVKRKFAKINLKLGGPPGENDNERERGKFRNRASSERSSVHSERNEVHDFQRSQSVSISTTSLASGEVVDENAKELSDDSKKTKKRRRRRYGRTLNDERKMEELYDLNLDSGFKLNAETLLIIDLLSLPDDKRQDFLLNRAKARDILVENQETHYFELNPKISNLRSILYTGKAVWEMNDAVKLKIQDLANRGSTQKVEVPKKEKARPLFEELVNAVVCEGLSDDQKKEFTYPVTPKKQRTKNYFCTEHFNKSLEEFAQKCVDANLGVIIEGEIRINAKNNDQAFIKHVYGEKDAMFTSQLIRKCALHGDIVRAFIRIKSSENNKETSTDANTTLDSVVDDDDDEPLDLAPGRSAKGFVIKIIEEVHNRRCVGSFLSYRLDSEYITFVPRDMKMTNIRIYRENWPESFTKGNMANIQDVLYVALITEWSGDICIGKILQAVGKCGELVAENNAILLQNKLSVNPYEDKFNEMFYGPLIITAEERKKRQDLSSECIFTIDPLTARDLDDAMSCKLLPNGNYEIGVHISDVAYFLEEDSELDNIVKQRTTSVYMVNEVYHMLPKPLCLKCSLLPGEEKLSFSVLWEITPEGEILNTKFFRSIINSCTQLAYEHAQKIIDFPDKEFSENDFPTIYNNFTATDIVEKVKVLHSIALKLRKVRFDQGALRINRPKLYFDLDENGAPANFGICELNTANFLIEEYMLLANQSVAKFIYDKFPEISILRNHEPPLPNVIKDLKERLNNLGLELDISSSKSIYESLIRLVSESENKDVMEICLSHIISKPMTRARYFCSDSKESEADFWHYALSIPIYTHFTSPIRRYPDVLVHRVLSAALDYTPPPKRTPGELQELAGICNEHKFNAKTAGDDSSNLYFLHYIKSQKSFTVRAAILDMWLHAMEVILIDTGHIVRVPYPKEGKNNVKFTLNNKTKPYTAQLVFTNVRDSKPQELKMFSEILIEVYVEKNKLRGRIPIPQTSSSENASKRTSSLSESSKICTKGTTNSTNLPKDPQPENESVSKDTATFVSNDKTKIDVVKADPVEGLALIDIPSKNNESSLSLKNKSQNNLKKPHEAIKSSIASTSEEEEGGGYKTEFINSSISLEILNDLILKATSFIAPLNKENLGPVNPSELLCKSSIQIPVEDCQVEKSKLNESVPETIDSSQASDPTLKPPKDTPTQDSLQKASERTLESSQEMYMQDSLQAASERTLEPSKEMPIQDYLEEASERTLEPSQEMSIQESFQDASERTLEPSEEIPFQNSLHEASECTLEPSQEMPMRDSLQKASQRTMEPSQEMPMQDSLQKASKRTLELSQEMPMQDSLQTASKRTLEPSKEMPIQDSLQDAAERTLEPSEEIPFQNCLQEASERTLKPSQEIPIQDSLQEANTDTQLRVVVDNCEESLNWATPPTSPLP